MSLASINSPSLVAASMTGVALGMPIIEKVFLSGKLSWYTIKLSNFLSYIINVASVSVPGRIDGQNQDLKEMKSFDSQSGTSLVTPSGW